MSHNTLRSGLIRLAHTHPEFRDQILPILKEGASQIEAGDAAVRLVEEHIPAIEVRLAPLLKMLDADAKTAGYTNFPAYKALKKAAADLEKAGKDLAQAIDKDWNGED